MYLVEVAFEGELGFCPDPFEAGYEFTTSSVVSQFSDVEKGATFFMACTDRYLSA